MRACRRSTNTRIRRRSFESSAPPSGDHSAFDHPAAVVRPPSPTARVRRNHCPRSIGIGARVASECAHTGRNRPNPTELTGNCHEFAPNHRILTLNSGRNIESNLVACFRFWSHPWDVWSRSIARRRHSNAALCAHSDAKRALIPMQRGQSFRLIAGSESDATRAVGEGGLTTTAG